MLETGARIITCLALNPVMSEVPTAISSTITSNLNVWVVVSINVARSVTEGHAVRVLHDFV